MAALLSSKGQVPGRSARRPRQARTLSPPPPRTEEQPQVCSMSRSFMTALPWSKLQVPGWSARRRDEHAPGVHHRLARRSRRKLALSVGVSCVCNQMFMNCTVVSQARPHKSVSTHLVPQVGRSSVHVSTDPVREMVCGSQHRGGPGGVHWHEPAAR